ncbi:hypothetical protein [Fodinibius sp.]|uniref:hypothetical protein n=1 Tax=Fodinibius sp. TaxID=1872440 RepID=UPI002ACDA28E|nr:hypothetical protein [Fodinibius sp.]MDZ7659477.1 hypothetical protein [Fodinibius sp.]
MKKISLLTFILFTLASSTFAQTSLSAGLNATGSMNVGYWGVSATIEAQHQLTPRLSADISLNGFHDLAPHEELLPNVKVSDYHRSVYSDLGLNFKLIDRKVDWSIGAGGSYQIGSEQYLQSASYYGEELTDYHIEKNNFSRFGVFVKNTIDFGQSVSLNIIVYRFEFWGEYMSIGPSFSIN